MNVQFRVVSFVNTDGGAQTNESRHPYFVIDDELHTYHITFVESFQPVQFAKIVTLLPILYEIFTVHKLVILSTVTLVVFVTLDIVSLIVTVLFAEKDSMFLVRLTTHVQLI